MKKVNLLLTMLLITPALSFVLFSQNNRSSSPIIYLHEHQTKSVSSQDLLASFSNSGDVVIDFYADWCGPCKRMSPIIDAYAASTPGVTFIKINRDHFMDLAKKFNITSIPTLIFLRNGRTIGRYDGGPLTQSTLAQLITKTYRS